MLQVRPQPRSPCPLSLPPFLAAPPPLSFKVGHTACTCRFLKTRSSLRAAKALSSRLEKSQRECAPRARERLFRERARKREADRHGLRQGHREGGRERQRATLYVSARPSRDEHESGSTVKSWVASCCGDCECSHRSHRPFCKLSRGGGGSGLAPVVLRLAAECRPRSAGRPSGAGTLTTRRSSR